MKRLLVVDDREESRAYLATLFCGHGWTVEQAHHGAEALELARREKPDLVISDLLMPVMDGYALLRQWRADPTLRAVPFVICTATYTEPSDEQLALDLGADAYIRKPTEPGELLGCIDGVLAGKGQFLDTPGAISSSEKKNLLEQYSATLVRKLEDKCIELDRMTFQLRANEAHLHAVIHCAPDCVKLLAADGTLLEMNAAGLQMLDAAAFEEVANHSLEPFVLPAHRSAFRQLVTAAMHGATDSLEFEISSLKGRRLWLKTRVAPLRSASGEIIAIVAVTRDITAARTAQTDLREALERLEVAIAAGRVGLWEWDLRTNQVVFSDEWKRQIGYSPDELANEFTEWESRLHPDDRERINAQLAGYLAGDLPTYDAKFRLRHKNGSYRYILAQATEIRDESGARTILRGSHVDITEHDELRAHVMQSQKMESVGQIATSLAHDFNNVLAVILGTTELVQRQQGPADPAAAQFRKIQHAAQRAVVLTRQLLAFSRTSATEFEKLDLNLLIEEVERLFVSHLASKIRVHHVLFRPLPPILADRGQIELLLVNLAVNARDAMPEGGTLNFETAALSLSGTTQGVRLTVSDTGTGMDEATRMRIFEPFFTTKARDQGTGLGLSTVFNIVRGCGASIDVITAPGQGTTFLIDFPAAPPHHDWGAAGAAEPRASQLILLVEDEDLLRDLCRINLESAGYSVIEASSGEEALHLLARKDQRVDLLLTDVMLPGLSGPEIARRALESHMLDHVLYISGIAQPKELEAAGCPTPLQFLAKPYTAEQLRQAVRRALEAG
jgi:PAS domain S-box-containing protein